MKIIQIEENTNEKDTQFFQLLMDETLAQGEIYIPKEVLKQVGSINTKLKAKRVYELLLRVAERFTVQIKDVESVENIEQYRNFEEVKADSEWESILTDCYIIARYKEKLLQMDNLSEPEKNRFGENFCSFNMVVASVLEYAAVCGLQQEAAALLEKFLTGSATYYQIYNATQPILIYKSEAICYNVLNVFSEQFGAALERAGERVEYFDPEKEGVAAITRYIGTHYKAIVGMQSYLFNVKMKDGETYLHDLIDAPKYNFVFDHPIWVRKYLVENVQNVTILTHDENYVKFIQRYFDWKARFFLPAGICPEDTQIEKKYNLSFVGTYGDYWNEMLEFHKMERKYRFLANRLLLKLRKNPWLTPEAALQRVLFEKRIDYDDKKFLEILAEVRRVIYCVMHYYRARVIETILKSGIQIDVFGSSWYACPLRKYPNLICHPDVTVEQSMRVWQESKMSLNIMSWHKGGFTERMANIMLSKTVLVTDDTSYLDNRFESEKDVLIFSLENMEELPKLLKKYLADEKKRAEIAESGYQKAIKGHTWDRRAQEFLEEELLRKDENCPINEYR